MIKHLSLRTTNGYTAVSVFDTAAIEINLQGVITVVTKLGTRYELVVKPEEDAKEKFKELVKVAFGQDA